MTQEEIQIAQAAYCVGKMWDEYEGTEDFDLLVGKRVLHLIELVRKSHPSLPSNLDEAAEDYEENKVHSISALGTDKDGFAYYMRTGTSFNDAFKAGAEWMARQGITKEAVIGMATEEISINVSQQTLDELDLCPGDKVVVQIRKK